MKKECIETLRIVVAETSVIVRSGMVSVLKRLPNVLVRPVEVSSPEALENCLHMDTPDILLVNPTFGGWFNVDEFRTDVVHASVKCIALNCNITDASVLQAYDESITLYEDMDTLQEKILRVSACNILEDEAEEKTIDLAEVTAQTMSRKRYMKKWHRLTDDEAEEELKQIALERELLEDSFVEEAPPGEEVPTEENPTEEEETKKPEEEEVEA